MVYRAVLFDLDGTLLDSIHDLANSMNSVLEHFGFPVHSIEAYKYFVGDGVENLVIRVLPPDILNQEMITNVSKLYREEYQKKWMENTLPYAGIDDMLTSLVNRKIKIAILSNKPDLTTKMIVEKLFPHIRFDVVVGAKPNVPHKPDPGAAIEISNYVKVKPSEFLYVGDTDTDMKTAKSSGMFAVGVLWGFRTADELVANGADILINHPDELISFFQNTNQIA